MDWRCRFGRPVWYARRSLVLNDDLEVGIRERDAMIHLVQEKLCQVNQGTVEDFRLHMNKYAQDGQFTEGQGTETERRHDPGDFCYLGSIGGGPTSTSRAISGLDHLSGQNIRSSRRIHIIRTNKSRQILTEPNTSRRLHIHISIAPRLFRQSILVPSLNLEIGEYCT